VVIVLTSSAEIKDQQRAYALGARTYLVKPPTGKCIRDILTSLESFWLGQGASSPVLIGTDT
jgi:CheY-like chemotaxis protein